MAHDTRATAAALVEQFERLDGVLFEQIHAQNFDAIFTTRAAKMKVKEFLAAHPTLHASGPLARKLKNIRDNVGYSIDKFFRMMNEGIERPSFEQEDGGDRDFIEALFTEGTASYVDDGFYRRRAQVGTLVLPHTLPNNLLRHVEAVKECHSLGLGVATVVFCRSVIEAAVFEALRRRGRIEVRSGIGEFSLNDLMSRVRPFLPAEIHKAAIGVIAKANRLLHSKNADPDTVAALPAIKDTFRLVETLFQ